MTPILGRISWPVEFRPNPAEVETIFDVPLNLFLSGDPSVHSFEDTDNSFGHGVTYRLHFFNYQGYTIWGLTAGILIQAASMALGREPEFAAMQGSQEYTDILYDDKNHKVKWRDPPFAY